MPENFTMAELEGDSEPIYDDRAELALNSEDAASFQADLEAMVQGDVDDAHDVYLAQKIMGWEKAGVPGDQIVDLLVDELARGEPW